MQPNAPNMEQRRQYIAGTFRIPFGLVSFKAPPIEWHYTDMLCRLSIRVTVNRTPSIHPLDFSLC
jgi:hypothetical protein